MKILMLGWELPPHNSGGLGVACLQLAKALASSGADIDFVLPFHPEDDFKFMKVTSVFKSRQHAGEILHIYDSQRYRENYANFPVDLSFEAGATVLAMRKEFDIIHAHDWLTFRAALRIKWQTGKPLVVHIHSIERDRAGGEPGNSLVREIEGQTMLMADQVIAVSERTKQAIIEDYDISADRIQVIHNSIDPDLFAPLELRNDYQYLEQMKAYGWQVVVNVGRITVQKGLPFLVRAAAKVIEKQPKTFFLFVGSGEQRDELLELAADLNIADKVIFAGFQRGKRWRDAYDIADLFVMPSVSEPFGLAPLEAIGHGTPVLVSRQSGVAEVLRNCLKVDYWDVDEMSNQIVSVLQNTSLKRELAINSAVELSRFSWENAANGLMSLYRYHAREVTA